MAIALTDETFEKEVLQYEGVVLVDFWAPWCGPCRTIAPIIEELGQTSPHKIAKMNVDEYKEVAGKYQIQSIPTLLLFKKGELVKTILGIKPKEELEKELELVANN